MGKKGQWYHAVTKIFCHGGIENKEQKNLKSIAPRPSDPPLSEPIETSEAIETTARHDATQRPPLPPPSAEDPKLVKHEEDPNSHVYSVALASAVAAEAAAVAAKAAAEVVRLSTNVRQPNKATEESAAVKIQTAFRGYQAKKTLRRLRGLVRLKAMVEGNAVHHQTVKALHTMQILSRVQSEVQSRRIRIEEENQAFLRQLQLKHERELQKLKANTDIEEDWDSRIHSKEEIEARVQYRRDAALRREKALAYAFSHQWKGPSRAVPPMFTDPVNPQWGWSWMERWMAARPWDNYSPASMNDGDSVKGAPRSVITRETSKALARRNNHAESVSTSAAAAAAAVAKPIHSAGRHESPSTPRPKSQPSSQPLKKSVSPKGPQEDDDSRSSASSQPERQRRHSIAEPLVKGEESPASTPTTFPHYLTSTTSIRAKSQPKFKNSPSPETAGSAKKRLSFPAAEKHYVPSPPGTRRHSGPSKVEVTPIRKNEVKHIESS